VEIERLWIERMGKLKDFEIEFSSPHNLHFGNLKVSVIVGENGTGKTSLLRFLSEVFVGSQRLRTNYSIQYEVNGKRNYVTNGGFDTDSDSYPTKVIVSTYSPFDQFKQSQSPSSRVGPVEYAYAGATTSAPIGATRTPTGLSSVYLPVLKNFFDLDLKKSKSIRGLVQEIGYSDFPYVELKRNLSSLRLDNIRSIGDNVPFDVDEKVQQLFQFNKGIAIRVSSKTQQLDNLPLLHPDTGVSKLLISPDSLILYPGGAQEWLKDIIALSSCGINMISSLWFPKKDALIRMSHLSSGELSLFFRFFRMIDAMVDNALVLIDEPEIHLHPKWIQKYVSIIKEVFGHYDAHIIMATHSPMIASDVPKECIIGLKYISESNRIEQYKVHEQTFGSSPIEILREVFGLETYFGSVTNDLISRIHYLLDNGEINKAQRLYNDLGDSDEKYSLFIRLKKAGVKES